MLLYSEPCVIVQRTLCYCTANPVLLYINPVLVYSEPCVIVQRTLCYCTANPVLLYSEPCVIVQ